MEEMDVDDKGEKVVSVNEIEIGNLIKQGEEDRGERGDERIRMRGRANSKMNVDSNYTNTDKDKQA